MKEYLTKEGYPAGTTGSPRTIIKTASEMTVQRFNKKPSPLFRGTAFLYVKKEQFCFHILVLE